jgi:phosphoribosylformimino-5-aminoimidazole carboxamide ribotide isomerase
MHLIPVIDLKNGIAVHAKLGLRANYLPLDTPLCPSSVVDEVIAAFLKVYPFKIIYLADLNAITKNGNNDILIKQLLQRYPEIVFWVDSGYQARPYKFLGMANYQAVLGSECYGDDELAALSLFEKQFILSLDFSAQQQPLGSAQLFNNSDWWSEKVIVMTLARVGSGAGVDLESLKFFQAMDNTKIIIASGGIKDQTDLFALQEIGIDYALCASALHSGAIGATQLRLPALQGFGVEA